MIQCPMCPRAEYDYIEGEIHAMHADGETMHVDHIQIRVSSSEDFAMLRSLIDELESKVIIQTNTDDLETYK